MCHRLIDLAEEHRLREFAGNAAASFKENPWTTTYSENEEGQSTNIESGDLLAIRWNICTLMVVRLDEAFGPRLYKTLHLIGGDFPPSELKPRS